MTAPGTAAPAARSFPVSRVAYLAVLALSLLVVLVWLGVGAVVAAVRYLPGLAESATAAGEAGNAWAAAFANSAHRSEPLSQLLVDYGLSAVNLGLALVLLLGGGRSWSVRLLALAMVGSAGAFNLQAHAAAPAVMAATGFSLGEIHQVVLHGIACAAFILALLVFPTPRYPGLPAWVDARAGRALFATVGVLALGLVGFGTALLPHTTSCVIFFGVLVPVVGLIVLPRRIRQGATGEQRTQARLVFALLVAAFAAIVVLGVVTVVLWQLGVPGLSVYDPTVHGATPDGAGEPIALLFWSSRLGAAAIAGAMFVAARADGLWRAERLFGRGLAGALAIASAGGGFVLVEALGKVAGLGDWVACLVAALPAAVAFQPLYRLAERITDRLLYGERPSPYAALAEVTAISRATAAEGPDLARIPEAVGRAVGATECRLTVLRPGLRDRTYRWSAPGAGSAGGDDSDLLVVSIRSGEREMGTIAVDRGAFAGLQAERRRLLEDIADSLGVVVAANRLGIELERQLRAALAHAAEIAASRRQAVSEMDRERRRIERDLHDGAQHQLVSLRLVLGLVEHEVDSGRLDSAAERLGVLAGQLDTAEAVLAETASGVRSMALVEQGLVAALETELCGPHTMVTVESTLASGRRFPPELEAAVYFCCLESVNNAHKHAPGAAVVLRFAEADGRLLFSVRDEGPGFEVPDAGPVGPQAVSAGRGLRNVASRIVAAGGRVDLRSAPGQGTTVEGSVPVPPPPEEPEQEPPTDVLAEVDGSLDGEPATTSGPVSTVRLSGLIEVPGPGNQTTAVSVVNPDALTTVITQRPRGSEPAAPPDGHPVDGVRPPRPGTPGRQPAGPPPSAGSPPARQSPAGPAVPAASGPTANGPVRPGPAVPDSLLTAVRAAATEARAAATGTGADRLDEVLRGLDRPLRIGVTGPPGSGVSTLLRALTEVVAPVPGTVLEELGNPADPGGPDELVLVLDARALPDGPLSGLPQPRAGLPPAIGVLARADLAPTGVDPWREAQRLAAEPAVRRACHTVLPVAALLATGGASIGPADAAELRHPPEAGPGPAGGLAARLGPTGARLAAELAQEGADPAWIGAELVRRSGILRLRELLTADIGSRADLLRARAALRALETVSDVLPAEERTRLRYQLDRIRSGAHELVELDLLDRLRTGAPPMADDERAVAERLLGAAGRSPTERLGLPPGATAAELRMSAAAQLSRWQQRASHPLSTADLRDAAGVLVRTCERLMALAAEPAGPAGPPAGGQARGTGGPGAAASAVGSVRPSSGR